MGISVLWKQNPLSCVYASIYDGDLCVEDSSDDAVTDFPGGPSRRLLLSEDCSPPPSCICSDLYRTAGP